MKLIAKLFLTAVLGTLAASIIAVPYALKQSGLASQRAPVLKLPVLDVFPLGGDDGRRKLLVMITNRSDEKIVPIEFSMLAPIGSSPNVSPALSDAARGQIAPRGVGVLFAELAVPENTEPIVTMMARIKYPSAGGRTEALFVTRRMN
jgi:hypothetical protein